MKITTFAVFCAAAVATGAPALASDDLAKNKGCNECHAMDKEVWGPSYKAIQKLYVGIDRTGAINTMAGKILKGGAEHWGSRQMPAGATRPVVVSEAESKQLAGWILTLK